MPAARSSLEGLEVVRVIVEEEEDGCCKGCGLQVLVVSFNFLDHTNPNLNIVRLTVPKIISPCSITIYIIVTYCNRPYKPLHAIHLN